MGTHTANPAVTVGTMPGVIGKHRDLGTRQGSRAGEPLFHRLRLQFGKTDVGFHHRTHIFTIELNDPVHAFGVNDHIACPGGKGLEGVTRPPGNKGKRYRLAILIIAWTSSVELGMTTQTGLIFVPRRSLWRKPEGSQLTRE